MEQSPMLLSSRPNKGKKMADLVHNRLAPPPGGGVNPQYVPLDANESHRNYEIASNMRKMAHIVNTTIMHTPTDAQRLNNPAQAAAFNQRQLSIPSSYGQFYAFMHALAAAFGNLS